ncbi:hypothetical protein C0J52_18822 [Blattella germanica]|nr:hypothetical protein C0J52_18822 [Blattella germanica]
MLYRNMSKRTNIRRPNPEGWLAIQSFFCSSQDNTSTHAKLIKQLRQEYDKIPLQEFFTYYIRCLKVLFKIGEKHLTVERALDFGAKFAVSLYNVNNAENSSVEDEEEEMPVFVKELFNWLFSVSIIFIDLCFKLNMLLL